MGDPLMHWTFHWPRCLLFGLCLLNPSISAGDYDVRLCATANTRPAVFAVSVNVTVAGWLLLLQSRWSSPSAIPVWLAVCCAVIPSVVVVRIGMNARAMQWASVPGVGSTLPARRIWLVVSELLNSWISIELSPPVHETCQVRVGIRSTVSVKPGFHYPSWRPVNSGSGNQD